MSVTAHSSLQFFWQDTAISADFRTGVSLHSHTMYSEESLGMVPRYTAKVPYLGEAIRRQEMEYDRQKGRSFNFEDAFWTPPLAPRQAYRLEEKQIQRKFQLPALVSLTDHDDIRAGSTLRVMDRFAKVPVSTEWTIPYGNTFFHLGVHNLPPARAAAIAAELAAFTADSDESKLSGILKMLNSMPEVLLILNHPLWDEKGVGKQEHRVILRRLLSNHRAQFHGLELNGLRCWEENRLVILLGRDANLPLLSGGDRHGREPNAILNLSRATTFAGFVEEVRYQGLSHMIFMPQYHEPLRLRILQTIVDVVRDYPENFEGRKSWGDRVYYRHPDIGSVIPLATIWADGGPAVVKHFIAAMRFLEWRGVRSALRLALNERTVSAWSDPSCSDPSWSDPNWSDPSWSDSEAA
jgi:hypothetical protein